MPGARTSLLIWNVGAPSSSLTHCTTIAARNSSFQLMHSLRCNKWWVEYLGPYHPCGRPGLNSVLPASACPNSICCVHIHKELVDGILPSLFLSNHQSINQLTLNVPSYVTALVWFRHVLSILLLIISQ